MATAPIQFRPRPTATTVEPAAIARTELAVEGMDCGSCVQHVVKALREVEGVASAQVELTKARATVVWKTGAAPDAGALVRSVKSAGYDARPVAPPAPDEFLVEGMTCGNCAQAVRKALSGIPGVAEEGVYSELTSPVAGLLLS